MKFIEWVKGDWGRSSLIIALIGIIPFTLFWTIISNIGGNYGKSAATITLLSPIMLLGSFILAIISFRKQGFNWKALITMIISVPFLAFLILLIVVVAMYGSGRY